jgi:DUF971 family protein
MNPISTIEQASSTDGCICIHWSDGHQSRYLHQWLRNNCACDACGTTLSGQRSLSLADFTDTISTDEVVVDNPSLLKVTWPDGHHSHYSAQMLLHYCNCDVCRQAQGPQLKPWDSNLHPEILTRDDARAQIVFDYYQDISRSQGLETQFAWDGDEIVIHTE